MFCSKCGNSLPDDAKFCGVCGAPVKISQEASPVPQQPASVSDEVGSVQMPKPVNVPKPEPLMQEPNFNGQMGYGAAAPVQKKSKKGLIIGLSLGGVLLVLVTVVIMFASGLFNSASSSPFPVLDTGKTQIYYGENFDSLEKEFPNKEEKRGSYYSLERSGDQSVGCLVRADKERGETKLVQWITTMNNTGLANGISIGDSYEKISTKYPDAMCSTEIRPNNPSKYDPEIDASVYFTVYMDENGNTYSYAEYEQKRADSIREQGNFDLAKWYALDFTVENGQITRIIFGDLRAKQLGH
ncbi:zinc-ribbon domain-containing protein [Hominenteromicrobium sp.]|uniref:zinc ribbon domain-containing protein n=1 Tax=Hominenteromicrobium sp. TaxID=3073581 RepID=UPI003AB364C2